MTCRGVTLQVFAAGANSDQEVAVAFDYFFIQRPFEAAKWKGRLASTPCTYCHKKAKHLDAER